MNNAKPPEDSRPVSLDEARRSLLMTGIETIEASNGRASDYCSSWVYLNALATDHAMRCGVDGRPVAPVSEADRLAAALRPLTMQLREASWETRARVEPIVDRVKTLANEAPPSPAPSSATPTAPAPAPPPAPMPARASQNGRPILSIKRV
jgi:hypothetical protein